MSMAIEKSEERLSSILLLQLACLIVVAFCFRLFVPAYSSLPHTYPILITLSGAPVGLVTKSWFTELLLPLIQSAFFLLMAGLVFWVMFSPSSLADLIPIDATDLRMLPEEMKKLRRRPAFFGSLISLLTLLCATYLFDTVLQSEITSVTPPRGMVLFIGIVLVFCVFSAAGWGAFVLRIK
jgi:uncharacterized membrane protein